MKPLSELFMFLEGMKVYMVSDSAKELTELMDKAQDEVAQLEATLAETRGENERLRIIRTKDNKYYEEVVANYYLHDEFRGTIKNELDNIEDGEWATLSIFRPIDAIQGADDD